MKNLLFLVHRLPYPPNKGDKVRSYHLLKHLAGKYRVFLGTFIDDPADDQYIETVRALCADLHVARIVPRIARLKSLSGLLRDEPLTLPYYRDRRLQRWVSSVCGCNEIEKAVVFSSAMAQYIQNTYRMQTLVDFVDVDSAKWTQYADQHAWPLSWIYRREGTRLLAYETAVAKRAARSFFVTENEVSLFAKSAPDCGLRAEAMCNGVDSEFFAPTQGLAAPYDPASVPIVFTGAMDYWPNVDAVTWFAKEILPALLRVEPRCRFYIVGRSPTSGVSALADNDVVVTGTVPDVRPYLQHAAVVVAPLRVARGVQNKVLEAMAMARPVVVSEACSGGVDAVRGRDFLVADNVDDYVRQITGLLGAPDAARAMGEAGRAQVLRRYSWEANMSVIDRYLDAPTLSPRAGT